MHPESLLSLPVPNGWDIPHEKPMNAVFPSILIYSRKEERYVQNAAMSLLPYDLSL